MTDRSQDINGDNVVRLKAHTTQLNIDITAVAHTPTQYGFKYVKYESQTPVISCKAYTTQLDVDITTVANTPRQPKATIAKAIRVLITFEANHRQHSWTLILQWSPTLPS